MGREVDGLAGAVLRSLWSREERIMAELFEVAELVKVAVEDERTGVAFYTRVAERGAVLQEIFAKLAEEEKFHQKRFEDMLKEMGDYRSPEQYPGEYMEYLHALTDNRAFPDERAAVAMADQCTDDAMALDVASRFERDTLILMNEVRSLVPEKDRPVVDELAKEEQGHLVTLVEARRKLQ